MNQRMMLVVTFCTVALTGAVLAQAGWLTPKASGASHQTSSLNRAVRTRAILESDAAWRWKTNQPHHWRHVMLQR